MIPPRYDPAPYLDALEHGRKHLEAMLKTLREESEQPTELAFLKDSGMIKEWKAMRRGER